MRKKSRRARLCALCLAFALLLNVGAVSGVLAEESLDEVSAAPEPTVEDAAPQTQTAAEPEVTPPPEPELTSPPETAAPEPVLPPEDVLAPEDALPSEDVPEDSSTLTSEPGDGATGGETGESSPNEGTENSASPEETPDAGATEAPEASPEAPLPEFSVEDGVLLSYNGDEIDVTIPEELEIEEIGEYAFAENKALRSVALPDSVRIIGRGAFLNCAALERVTLPKRLRSVGMEAFDGCPLLIAYVRAGSPGLRYCQASGLRYRILSDDATPTPKPTPTPTPAPTATPEPSTSVGPGEATPEPGETRPPVQGSIHLENGDITLGCKERVSGALKVALSDDAQGAVYYTSSDPKVVTVDLDGNLCGVSVGSAIVTAALSDDIKASCAVTVCKAPTRIALELPATSLGLGEELDWACRFDEGAYSFSQELTSSQPGIVKVEGGKLVAVAEGSATITAKAFNGAKASVKLSVKPAPQGLSFTSSGEALGVGMELALSAAYANSSAAGAIEYAIAEGGEFAELNGNLLTALAPGEVSVTATAYNGVSAAQTLRIVPAPASIRAAQTGVVTLYVGEIRRFEFTVLPEDARTKYTYASSDSSVARVDANGNISCLKTGEAVLFVITHNGLSAPLRVRVTDYHSVHETLSVGHRGASGYKRENTADAFRYAAKLGADMIETDVRETKDGKIVFYHDTSISSGGSKKKVSSLTLAQLRKIDSRILTLDEGMKCLSTLPFQVMIEFKTVNNRIIDAVIKSVESYGMEGRVIYGSFDKSCAKRVHNLRPGARTVIITSSAQDVKNIIASPEKYSYATDISVQYDQLTAAYVRDLHLRGFAVYAWTVDSASAIQSMAKMGVDGVISNYPDRVLPYR